MRNNYGGYNRQPFIAEYYDVSYSRRSDIDIPFYVEYAQNSGGSILELACGTGRVLIPTARTGCEITGLDLSTFMLGKCREKLANEPSEVQKQVTLVQGNMTDFSLGKKFDLITIPFRAFQHLMSVNEQKACLNCVRRHLTFNGHFVFDIYHPSPHRLISSPEMQKEREDLPETLMRDGRKVKRCSRIPGCHRDEQYNEIELIYYVTYPDGRQERLIDAFPMRYYFRYEVEHLLEICGMKVINLYGNFEKSPFTDKSPEMIFIAGKK
jgi:SAM-dependent methyltransferase